MFRSISSCFGCLFFAAVAVVLIGVGAAFMALRFLPNIVDSKLEETTGFDVQVGSMDLGLRDGSFEITNFLVNNPRDYGDVQDFIDLDRFRFDVALDTLNQEEIVIEELTLIVRSLTLVRKPGGVDTNAGEFFEALGGPPAPRDEAPAPDEPTPPPPSDEPPATEEPGQRYVIKKVVVRLDRLDPRPLAGKAGSGISAMIPENLRSNIPGGLGGPYTEVVNLEMTDVRDINDVTRQVLEQISEKTGLDGIIAEQIPILSTENGFRLFDERMFEDPVAFFRQWLTP